MSLRIGVISDTHGLLRPEVAHYLAGVSHIIHAGDIGTPDILERLRRIAPVTAIRGNVDVGNWARHYPETETLRLGGRGFYLLHDLKTLEIDPAAHDIDAVISGHSHRVQIKTINGILFLNPGSAGPRRFHLPITLATLDLDETGALQPMIHHLDR
jgi:uncharacterized protein